MKDKIVSICSTMYPYILGGLIGSMSVALAVLAYLKTGGYEDILWSLIPYVSILTVAGVLFNLITLYMLMFGGDVDEE